MHCKQGGDRLYYILIHRLVPNLLFYFSNINSFINDLFDTLTALIICPLNILQLFNYNDSNIETNNLWPQH